MLPAGLRILMIEDCAMYAALIERLLKQVGWELVVADRVAAAIELAADSHFDAALVDLSVADSMGMETFERIHSAAPRLPIVVLTGSGDESLGVHTVQAGAQDFVMKGDMQEQFLARTVTYAIERKRSQEQLALYADELWNQNQQMRAGLQLARQVQLALLPPGSSERSGALELHHRFLPTDTVGGDFFALTHSPDGGTGLILCDVMGHGVRAALVTGVLRAFVDDTSMFAAEPPEYLANLNRKLRTIFARTEANLFVTAFCLVADRAGQLTFTSAGHPSPLLLDPSTGTAAPLSTLRGAPLALTEAPVYGCERATLLPGQRLLLFTDGLYEAEGVDGEPFGVRRLCEVVQQRITQPGEELIDGLLEDVQHFASDGAFADDVCVITVDSNPNLSPSGFDVTSS